MLLNGQEVTDGITSGIEVRKQRGLEIAALARITHTDGCYLVPAQYTTGQRKYRVRYGEHPTCTCPDFETRGCRCKHIYAVEYVIRRETVQNPDGSSLIRESLTITKTRKTYPQNWAAYNEAQTNEKEQFQVLLADLCKGLETPKSNGRPRLPLSDAMFSAVFKVYSTMSARRFTSDLCDAQSKGYIGKVPHFNSVLGTLESAALYPVLLGLIERSSQPLRAVESKFAVDSTGFTSCRFVRWYDVKYNKFTAQQQWVKAHLMCGVKTNVVTAVEIHDKDASDSPQLPSLLASTVKNFDVKELSADKGYSSQDNHIAIAKANATPFIAFKDNTTAGVGGLFAKAFHYFQFKREEFLTHYHQRSNVEPTIMMIKTKFGDSLRSKSDVAARNEVLCKILCHNICCLISAMYELGIEPMFAKGS